jgi:diguanylate cyclase (GGDEF)-like protein
MGVMDRQSSARAGLGRLPLLGRLESRAGQPVALSKDRGTMARTFAYLFGLGATLLVVTLLLPGADDRDTLALAGLVVVAYATSVGFLVAYDRLPLLVYQGAPLFGVLVVSLGVWFAGASSMSAYAMYYFWVVLAGSYFFETRIALVHIVAACAAYGAVLVLHGGAPHPLLLWVMAAGTLSVTGILMAGLREQVDTLLLRLSDAARTDALTGLANRRALEERFVQELERATRSARPLGIVALDLDWFKEFNDRFGHAAGDRALQRLGAVLREHTRRIDTVARLGGEEFAVLAPETGEDETIALAERLREKVRDAFAEELEGLTISCGVACFPVHGMSAEELLRAADRALYEAKELGRDRSVAYEAPEGEGDGDGIARRVEVASPRLASLVWLAEAVDGRKGTPGHSETVAGYAEALAQRLRMPEDVIERVRLAALLRDVGEVGVPESILAKGGALDLEEWRDLRSHPEIGARIVGTAQLGRVSECILAHHERPDGKGYPRGLHDQAIPIEAKILAVVDAYAAMTVDRPYRARLTDKRARAELQAGAGTQFDHDVVETFLELQGGAEDTVPGEAQLRAVDD